MKIDDEYLDIINREGDYKSIYSETFRAELGIRAIGLIYHDHSADTTTFNNIFQIKDNIEYRLFSVAHQYLIFLREMGLAEKYLQKIYAENPRYIDQNTFPTGNPYFDKVETELSSIFDSIIFHLSSVFDYLSHTICYMYFSNKEKALYWPSLRIKVRGDWKGRYEFCSVLDQVDRRFVGHLYDYRSRLLHNKRDKHKFSGFLKFKNREVRLLISCSDISLKKFSLISEDNNDNKIITLCYLSSWLIKRTFIEIENILDSIKIDFEKYSKYYEKLGTKIAKNELAFASFDPKSKSLEPASNLLWKEYKKM